MWLLAPAVAVANPAQLFAQGVGAFHSGDFASALRYFQQAHAAGFNLPTLYFNLGASLYKLGRYAEAEDAFRECARDPNWASLANYNAGLSAYKRGQRTAAAGYFERAWRLADSTKVRALALTMLERTDLAASRRPRGLLALNLGYNDNVALSADNQTLQTSSEGDRFSELLASATGRWGSRAGALNWDASLYDLRYARLADNNITSVTVGVGKPAKFEPWYTDISAQEEYALRDGHPFQQIFTLRVEGTREHPDQSDLRLGAEVSSIDALDDNFAFLDGSSQQVDASIARRIGDGRARLGVAIERNRRADLANGVEFFSFSPTHYSVRFVGSWPLAEYVRWEPIVRYTRSRYADPDRRASGVVATREDRARQLALRATYRLTAAWRLLGEFSYIDNRSNFPEFSYSQRAAWIGMTRRF